MGKRVPVDEKPFNPVEAALIRSVMAEEPPPPEPLARITPPLIGDIHLQKKTRRRSLMEILSSDFCVVRSHQAPKDYQTESLTEKSAFC